jgi:nitrate reductase cytochrome c-type subunit
MKKFLKTSSVVLLISSSLFANEMSKEEKKMIALEAKKAMKIVGGGLLKEVKKNMKEGGVLQAAAFCANNASELTAQLSKNLDEGVSVRRITNKPRNSNNIAKNDFEQSVLDKMEKEDRKKHPVVKKVSANHYQVYKPIRTNDKCLVCHGDATKRNAQAYEQILAKFPNDKAINYKAGEFRGAFLIDIIKK